MPKSFWDTVWIALFFVMVLALGFEALTASQQIPSEQEHYRADRTKRDPDTPIVALNEPHSSEQAAERKEKQTQAAEHFIEFLNIKLSDALIALFTVVLAVKTAGLFKETAGLREATFRLYEAGERQFEFLRKSSAAQGELTKRLFAAESRPWLNASAIEPVDLMSYHEKNGLTLTLRYELQNIGKTPALGVSIEQKLFVGAGTYAIQDELKAFAKKCGENHPPEIHKFVGATAA